MPADLTGFDYIVLTLIGLLALMGFVRGLTHEALSLAAWVLGGVVTRFFHEDVTLWLAPRTGGEASAAIIAFLLLFFGTVIIGRIIAGMAGGATRRSALGAMDRVLGFGFGAVKGVILAAILFLLVQFGTGLFDPERRSPDWLLEARSAPLLQMTADVMVDWVEELQQPAVEKPHPAADQGYTDEDRRALDRLLESGEALEI
ncbi:MAG: CvpA family protein [Sphingomonadaceae bacterium]